MRPCRLFVVLACLGCAVFASSARAATDVWTPAGPFVSPLDLVASSATGSTVVARGAQGSHVSVDGAPRAMLVRDDTPLGPPPPPWRVVGTARGWTLMAR